ncbi:MAG: response regulator transcription factor [Syntrophobacterales bacterium]|jgi:DNA-binding NarL/FixJ family response regulator|nr:response regulator transcription factor [Syntrophobacterales bacterium]
MYNIVLAEDHILVREGIKKIIEGFPGLKVVGEVGDGSELLELLKSLTVDMAIIDITMPSLPGIEATREIKKAYPGVKVLILTMHKKKEYLNNAIAAGIDGYLLKEDAPKELLNAIDKIRQGMIYVSPLLSGDLANLYVRSQRQSAEDAEPLSPREIEIIKLIAEGKSSKEIAEILFLSFRTIQNHRTRIMKKLNLKKNTDLVRYAIRKGYAVSAIP